ncbi:MAG: thiamine-monophosphate kinase [Planctomycetia bacterium]|nr:thiamine-monophosphate kinase [Planctomycetia bacterium]
MESEFISWLRERLPSHRRLELGIGDDAALVRLGERQGTLVTVDVLTDGVDFRLAQVDPRRVGRKALAVSLSDIAAMAGRPLAAVLGAVLPRESGLCLAKEICEGMIPLAERYDVALAGGDTNTWDGPLVLSVTVLGEPTERGPLRRDGARPGDAILVTGNFGGSILGHHLDFWPRLDEALALHKRYELHAGIDVSDGLSLDLSRIAAASGCGAVVDVHAVPIAEAARQLARQSGGRLTALDHALADGEDFELILAVPPAAAEQMLADQPVDVPLTMIGQFTSEPGLWQKDSSGRKLPLPARGYEH